MRTIKFRAKTLNEGEWVQSMTIAHGTIKRKAHNLYMEVAPDKWKGIDPKTLGQYTGVNDVNGKPIFEGDIVRVTQIRPQDIAPIDRGVYVVEFNPWYGWRFGTDYVRYVVEAQTKLGAIDKVEIIGNIHDKPKTN